MGGGGGHVCACTPRASAHTFGQMIYTKYDVYIVNSELILSDGHRKL